MMDPLHKYVIALLCEKMDNFAGSKYYMESIPHTVAINVIPIAFVS